MSWWRRVKCLLGWHWRLQWADETIPPDPRKRFLWRCHDLVAASRLRPGVSLATAGGGAPPAGAAGAPAGGPGCVPELRPGRGQSLHAEGALRLVQERPAMRKMSHEVAELVETIAHARLSFGVLLHNPHTTCCQDARLNLETGLEHDRNRL